MNENNFNFDDLFNEFFKKHNINPKDEMNENMMEHARKMMDMLSKFSELTNSDEFEESMDNKLGEPDKIEYSVDGDLYMEIKTWYTENGELIKTTISDNPNLIEKKPITIELLEEKLKIAVKEEEYEKAAAIRDEIKKLKKEQKKLDKLKNS